MSAEKQGGTSRVLALDAARGLAVILMVQQHLGIWALDRVRFADAVRGGLGLINLTGGAAAPLFITLSGIGVALALNQGTSSMVFLRRGLTLFCFALLLNLLTPSWFSASSFYVLHLLAAWLLAAPLFRRIPTALLLPLAVLILAVAIGGQAALETPMALWNRNMKVGKGDWGPLRLAFFEGHFPIFPWLALAIGGLWAGRQVSAGRVAPLFYLAAGSAASAGLARLAVSLSGIGSLHSQLVYEQPWRALFRFSFYPATTVFMLLLFAIALGVVGLFCLAERKSWLSDSSALVCLGRVSLSLLFFHVVLFREVAERLGLRHSFTPTETVLEIVIFLTISAGVALAWRNQGYRYSLEWWLRRLSR